jgi:NADPH:quinone reductase-like Zn-dependent oxidoreductase
MKAIVQDSYGSADVLHLAEIETPEAGADEVLVRVRAASVNIGDWHLMAGLPYLVRLAGLRRPGNPVRGMDVAGIVEVAGANVTRFAPGDEVFGVASGSLAEFTVAKADKLVLKPAGLSFEQAAAVPVSAVTALQSLASVRAAGPGERVLVIGASGAVGGYAVQLARAFGAQVTGVASTGKLDYVLSLGASVAVDYTRNDITRSGERYDLVVDTAGNRSVSSLRKLLAGRGTLVIVGGEGGGRVTGGFGRSLGAGLVSPFVRQKLTGLISTVHREDLVHGRDQTGELLPHKR